ncbi:gamma-aminobutyric acid type B receptor subunit 1-like [Asterias rubens]|uniref:gamma-aminobutyric acid type B receptor subunit 1-like n=1 Tax=Asterias rubens TaxID=7604 RepID=UPI001455B6E0|nr:gamma-aminobutyric acid type B receptor subunit 1-like [Asterias rubens]
MMRLSALMLFLVGCSAVNAQVTNSTQGPMPTTPWASTNPGVITTVAVSLPHTGGGVTTDTMTSGVQFMTPQSLPTTATTQVTNSTQGGTTIGTSVTADPRYPLYIMGFFPITGDSFHRGSSALLAANLALEHINEQADILPGYKLAMKWNDSNCNAGIATQGLFEHINSDTRYHMLLGAGCSSVAQTISLAADLWNIIQVSYSASSPALSVRNQYKSFFRTNAADSQYNFARLAMIKKFNWTRVATLHENQEVFSTSINDFSSALANSNIDLITSESFTTSPKEQVLNLKNKEAWIIFGNFYEKMARRVFCEAYEIGLYGKNYAWFLPGGYKSKWWAEPDPDVPCTKEQMYEAVKGYISTENIPLSKEKDKVTISGLTPTQYETTVNERFERAKNTSSDFIENKAAASYAYDATWTIALALNKSLVNLTTKNLEDFDYEDTETRDLLMEVLYSLQFDGVSGKVSFTEVGNREGLIEIRQLKGQEEEAVGYYSPQEENLNITNIEWPGGKAPKDATTVENITQTISPVYIYVASGLSGVGVIFVVVLSILMFIYRQRSAFRRAMPGYLGLMLFGCALLYCSVVLLGMDSSFVGDEYFTVTCKLCSVTLTIGFACAYGVLFAKIYRAHKLLVMKTNLWKPDPHGGHMARTLMIFLVVDVVALVVWIVVFPMESSVVTVGSRDNFEENTLYNDIVEFCNKDNSIYFIVGLFVFHGLALLLGAFLAYETRELKILSLNDIFSTGIAVYCVVTLSVVSAPLSFILSNTPEISFAVIGTLTWCAITLLLIIVFIPKLMSLRHTFSEKKDMNYRTDDEIYEDEVDEETKLRHKIDEVDRQIDIVKTEINRRTNYGRQGTKQGCGLWCLGYFIGCNCGQKSSEVAEIIAAVGGEDSTESRTLAYDNKGLQVSDWNLDEGAHAPSNNDVPTGNGIPTVSTEVDDADTSDITVAVEAYHEPPKYSTAIAQKTAVAEKATAAGGGGLAAGVAAVAGVAAGVASQAARKAGETLQDEEIKDDNHEAYRYEDGGKDQQEPKENDSPPISMQGNHTQIDENGIDQDADYIESTMM